ncbi:Hypothetical protein GLP15_5108 [Giardia lamblia P15]|uniref:Uncharacterized protein n=1 Tax=Giardia intestinalis (strain P15) TaxID=658858 RepID=E1EYH3_GIAIA|nr:Hypothetical protein GLP15_5108 [Giardia lamblia P15]
MLSDTLLVTQEWILSRMIYYTLTNPDTGASSHTLDTSIDVDAYVCNPSTNILHSMMDSIASNQSLSDLDSVRVIRIICTYMMIVFDKKFQFSGIYSKKFGMILLRCTRDFVSNNLSAKYLTELSQLIFLHMQHSDVITVLVASSQCLLDMISEWLKRVLLSGHNTNSICILISSIVSAPVHNVGCNTIARYRHRILSNVLEYLDSDVLQTIKIAIESDSHQACAYINGLIEMLITANVVQIVNKVPLELILNLISLLCKVVQVGVVAQRIKSQTQRGSWMDLLAITNASVLLSMILICLVDSEKKDHSMRILLELMEITGSDVQELEEFLTLQIMRFKACHQVVNALDEDRVLMLSVLQSRITMILSSCVSLPRLAKIRETDSSKNFYIERSS